MKVDSSLKKGFIYLLLAIVPIVVSVIYGQLMVSNIGHFSDYGEIVFNLGLTGIIVIPVVVTIYYIGLVIFGSKSGLIKWNIQQFSYILMFLAMLAYMAFITFTSDIRGSCNPGYVETHPDMVTLDERIWAFFSFYLGILTIYNFFCLIRPVKGFKQAIAIFCILIILFDIVMIASPMPFPGMPYKKDARIQQSRLAFARTSRFLLIFTSSLPSRRRSCWPLLRCCRQAGDWRRRKLPLSYP